MQNQSLNIAAEQGVSIVIGARNEYPQIAMTICNLIEDCRSNGIEKYEIILQDNGSDDETSRFFAWKPVVKTPSGQWKYQKSLRGLVNEGKLRIFFDPVFSNVGTRNKGVLKAKYPNIIFSDAHIIVRPGTVKQIINTLDKFGGVVHSPIAWMGASAEKPQAGFQYSYKVGEKIWGTWNKVQVADTAFYIPFCGHAFIAVKKKEFLDLGGYPYAQRVYGGGEPHLDTKYWMMGSTSMMDPKCLIYHLSAGRGYNWHSEDLLHNMFLVSYILGGKEWSDRILITYYNKPNTNKDVIKRLHDEALEAGEEERTWLDKNKKYSFKEVLALGKESDCQKCTKRGKSDPHAMRTWDIRNEELHGTHRSFVQEFLLERRDGKIFIGNTEIVDKDAIEIAKLYLN